VDHEDRSQRDTTGFPQPGGCSIMSEQQIRNVVRHFGISPEWIPDFVLLFRHDRIDNHDFGALLKRGRFKAALEMCLEILSADWVYLFDDDGELERAQAIAGNF
jgi:hypothetical protein